MSEPERIFKSKLASSTRPTKQRSFSRTPDRKSPRLLPPIRHEKAASTGGSTSPAQQYYHLKLPSDRLWSRYHEGCIGNSSMYLNWFAVKIQNTEAAGSSKGRNNKGPAMSLKNEEEELAIADYLDRHRDFLEAYITDRVPSEELERWHLLKLKPNSGQTDVKQSSLKSKAKISKKQMFIELLDTLKRDPSEYQIMLEFARCLTNTIGVDAYRIYKLMPENTGVVQYFYEDQSKPGHESRAQTVLVRAGANEVFLVLEVARRGAPLRLSRLEDRNRFPDTPYFLFKASKTKKDANHVMYQPVLVSSGETGFIIEMWRYKEKFRVVDEEASSSFMLWGSLALHYCNVYLEKTRERNMTDFLLHVVKAIFEEMISLDQLIKTILEFAQHLVNADRASLFLLDDKKNELVSTVFDLKFESGQDMGMEKKEIRMPVSRGIAGYVAKSGETMNIPDAYADHRFNREVDAATGYRTMNILCMPIKVEGEVIGVVQMVNKRSENNFGRDDEVAFEIFSTFFGLALKHARLYDRIMRNEQKYKVALEVLSYHNTCRENEVKALQCDVDLKDITVYDLNDFYLDPYKLNEYEKCKSVLTMFNDLFGTDMFDTEILSRFVLTVKKNYRTVPYHNFDHGWAVANAMYNILKTDHRLRFDYKARLALFVACLCHDLDHRGYTNKYMSETASPLAAMYTTSTLEHHHFNITVTILQQEGHNIFSHMSSEEYKYILGQIRQAILATDLAAFFPNLANIKKLHDDENSVQFDWDVTSHRDLAMAISMTAADLSAASKPWEVQIKTVKVIFEEFYDQGDKEYAAGRTPIPMMDRNKTDQQSASQVGFLSQICIPCYEMLWKILPNTKPMYVMASRNLVRWKARAEWVLHRLEPRDDDERQRLEDDESTGSDIEGEYVSLKVLDTHKFLKVNTEELSAAGVSPKSDTADTLHDINLDTWEEDNDFQSEDKIDREFYKNIDDSDDEEVVVEPKTVKKVINNLKHNDANGVDNNDRLN